MAKEGGLRHKLLIMLKPGYTDLVPRLQIARLKRSVGKMVILMSIVVHKLSSDVLNSKSCAKKITEIYFI